MTDMPRWARAVVSAMVLPVDAGEVVKMRAFVQVEQEVDGEFVRSRFAIVEAYNCGHCDDVHVEFSYTHEPVTMTLARRADGSAIFEDDPDAPPV